ncbi:MAG: hypothetical protein Q8922_03200 [Bacteroidota bacterium]|nr:hypothetical protein [Bacteroidota bacterium]
MMRRVALISLLLTVASPGLRAQSQIGFEFGVGRDTQSGEVDAACGCSFADGSGTGFRGAVSYEAPLFFGIRGGVKSGLEFKRTHGSIAITEPAIIQASGSGTDTVMQMPINRVLDVSITYITFMPYLSYFIPGIPLFLQLGTTVSDLQSSTFKETRQLATTSLTVNGHTIPDMRFQNGATTETLSDGPIQDANKLRVAAQMSIGYYVVDVFGFGVAPMVTYDLPLSTVRDVTATNWKISSIYGTVMLKFGL